MASNHLIRPATIKDAPAILNIYSYYVDNTTITFELSSPGLEEMEKRIAGCLKPFDWIVYESDGKVLGYSYYSGFRDRKAYDYACETTVYVHHDFVGKGIGTALYGQLLEKLRRGPQAVAIGGIALPNEPSIRLHQAFGFKNIGILKNVGRKFNTWIDVGYWELELKKFPDYHPEKKACEDASSA